MNEFELIAEQRSDVGKGASRRLRRDGNYPVSFTVPIKMPA